ncbi:Phospholipid N-methyltransferase [Actinopolyspora lacussalsi subsp. righensis]|uniref:Phospholipid N-methyltransferase n=1 Tax=Actinopolyspora righensis TaxID=995060 RepID=A0A1I6ZP77_9ACTN|nr:methyltransferase domain-containing protein [Actinopolyspora righensis]SFT64508.1 Phospholipid N-methyltransferase [Actinopolyspora righensis]
MTRSQQHRSGDPAGPASRSSSLLSEYRTFVNRAVREPSTVGAVLPSSPVLAREMAAVVPSVERPVVVELGPGTGALSGAIAERVPEGGRHVAVEVDPGMCEHLRTEAPWLEVLQGDAMRLGELLAEHGIESADAVVSGLPWSLFAAESQRRILREIGSVLAPGGGFTTIAYAHALGMSGARRFRDRLGAAFDEVITSRTVWRNVPPARVYVCRRPVSRR